MFAALDGLHCSDRGVDQVCGPSCALRFVRFVLSMLAVEEESSGRRNHVSSGCFACFPILMPFACAIDVPTKTGSMHDVLLRFVFVTLYADATEEALL